MNMSEKKYRNRLRDLREELADRVEDHDDDDNAGNDRRYQETDDIGRFHGGFGLAERSELCVKFCYGKDGEHAGVDHRGAAFLCEALDGGNNGVELLVFLEHDEVDRVVDEDVDHRVHHRADSRRDKADDAAVHEIQPSREEQDDIEDDSQDLRPQHGLPAALELL